MIDPDRHGGEAAADTASLAGRCTGDDERWAAVVNRDLRAVGRFFYSVATTGVYCRPGCSARRPRRENVRFHATREEAEGAGFRPCRRCRPDRPPLAERRAEAVARACRFIETTEEMPSLDALAEAAGMSRYHFHRVFKGATGITPRAYAAARRAERMREALRGGGTVTEAVYDAGFNSNGRFYAEAADVLGMAPASYRRGGAAETIRFAAGVCSLGSILVAATAEGVCAILLGDDPDALIHELEARFPNAQLIGGDPAFEARVAQVVGFVEAPALGLDLPLDVRGTAFQRRVWQALRRVPAGETASYRQIAEHVGAPKAARAVARACAANVLAVAIPCHRVVRGDGALSGYRWGVERKRALLDREAAPRSAGAGTEAGGAPAAAPRPAARTGGGPRTAG